MFVKWDGQKIIAGPQSLRGDDSWLPYIPAQNKHPRGKSKNVFSSELNCIVQVAEETWEAPWNEKRANEYGKVTEQLDKLFHDIENGTLDKTGKFYTFVKGVKDAIPKPEESNGD